MPGKNSDGKRLGIDAPRTHGKSVAKVLKDHHGPSKKSKPIKYRKGPAPL